MSAEAKRFDTPQIARMEFEQTHPDATEIINFDDLTVEDVEPVGTFDPFQPTVEKPALTEEQLKEIDENIFSKDIVSTSPQGMSAEELSELNQRLRWLR